MKIAPIGFSLQYQADTKKEAKERKNALDSEYQKGDRRKERQEENKAEGIFFCLDANLSSPINRVLLETYPITLDVTSSYECELLSYPFIFDRLLQTPAILTHNVSLLKLLICFDEASLSTCSLIFFFILIFFINLDLIYRLCIQCTTKEYQPMGGKAPLFAYFVSSIDNLRMIWYSWQTALFACSLNQLFIFESKHNYCSVYEIHEFHNSK